jgi:hypothetical protein
MYIHGYAFTEDTLATVKVPIPPKVGIHQHNTCSSCPDTIADGPPMLSYVVEVGDEEDQVHVKPGSRCFSPPCHVSTTQWSISSRRSFVKKSRTTLVPCLARLSFSPSCQSIYGKLFATAKFCEGEKKKRHSPRWGETSLVLPRDILTAAACSLPPTTLRNGLYLRPPGPASNSAK